VDDFITLSNRLLSRCPAVGIQLAQQLINDSWHVFQSRREWSFRRRSNAFAPPDLYQTGTASTNVSTGSPTLITGIGTTWTPFMVGRQIRLGGLLYPYYDIVGYLSPTQLLIGQPWAGGDVVAQPYQILQCFYPVPSDFNYFYVLTSIKDSYRLWTNVTESELGILDPQRTNQGQTFVAALRDYTPNFGGTIGFVLPVAATGAAPVSTTTFGFSYVSSATYIIQVTSTGISGVATFQWMRSGQSAFVTGVTTADTAQDLQDGVQVYWPDGQTYNNGDLFVINCQSQITAGVPRYELWPAPTYSKYLYPYIYIAKELDLTAQQPQLPPFVANRGEVLLEMAMGACARYPGPDLDHPNPYFNLALAQMHDARAEAWMNDMERNDEEVGLTNMSYESYPMSPSPWQTGSWQQSHAPYM
jgi:hypothetical protein